MAKFGIWRLLGSTFFTKPQKTLADSTPFETLLVQMLLWFYSVEDQRNKGTLQKVAEISSIGWNSTPNKIQPKLAPDYRSQLINHPKFGNDWWTEYRINNNNNTHIYITLRS